MPNPSNEERLQIMRYDPKGDQGNRWKTVKDEEITFSGKERIILLDRQSPAITRNHIVITNFPGKETYAIPNEMLMSRLEGQIFYLKNGRLIQEEASPTHSSASSSTIRASAAHQSSSQSSAMLSSIPQQRVSTKRVSTRGNQDAFQGQRPPSRLTSKLPTASTVPPDNAHSIPARSRYGKQPTSNRNSSVTQHPTGLAFEGRKSTSSSATHNIVKADDKPAWTRSIWLAGLKTPALFLAENQSHKELSYENVLRHPSYQEKLYSELSRDDFLNSSTARKKIAQNLSALSREQIDDLMSKVIPRIASRFEGAALQAEIKKSIADEPMRSHWEQEIQASIQSFKEKRLTR